MIIEDDPEIYGWRGDDPFLSRLNAEKVEIARKSGSNMYVHLKDYERLAGNLRDCREVLRSTDEALQDSACEIERLTRELEEERELHLTARGQSDAYEMGMESWKDGYERLTRELEAMEDARDIAQAEGALMEMERDRLRAALEQIAKGEGPFSLDNHQFACNVIEESKRLAREALGEPKP